MEMADAIAQKPTNCDTKAHSRVPEADLQGLLVAGIPHAADEDECRIGARLRRSAENAECGKTTEVLDRGLAHQENSPGENVET